MFCDLVKVIVSFYRKTAFLGIIGGTGLDAERLGVNLLQSAGLQDTDSLVHVADDVAEAHCTPDLDTIGRQPNQRGSSAASTLC